MDKVPLDLWVIGPTIGACLVAQASARATLTNSRSLSWILPQERSLRHQKLTAIRILPQSLLEGSGEKREVVRARTS